MRNKFEQQLTLLNNELIEMGNLIETAIQTAIEALVNQDIEKAQETVAFDSEIDDKEKSIESLCLKLLLQQQPVAKDLREISAALKMITDMERIGDHAADISEITIMMRGEAYIKELKDIQRMSKETIYMVIKSIEAFVAKDLSMAEKVISCDDVVDNLFDEIRLELIQIMNQDIDKGEQATDLLMVAKYLERIGDHATNIAEWVIFSITGQHKN